MKTPALLPVSALAGVLFAAVALAGPGPQFWIKPTPASPNKTTLETPPAPTTAACTSCKTSRIWAISDRGGSGRGAPGAYVSGYAHACPTCTAKLANGHATVVRDAKSNAKCGMTVCCR